MSLENKTIITAALTGSLGSKDRNPNTPVSPDEIIADAYRCFNAGAAIVHIHVKDENRPSSLLDYDKFNYIREGIRDKCDVIINFSTSGESNLLNGLDLIGSPDSEQKQRLGVLNCQPEIATFDVPTMNFDYRLFINPLSFLKKLGSQMLAKDILPEVEIFSVGDIDQVKSLIAGGYLTDRPFYQLCLGIKGGTPASIENLVHLQRALPDNANWSAFGVGKDHLPILYTALAMGGHLRVGLEDNLYYRKGQLTSNSELVERAGRIIREFGNSVASPDEAREILGLHHIQKAKLL